MVSNGSGVGGRLNSVHVTVLCFGPLRELSEAGVLSVDVPMPATPSTVIDTLAHRSPKFAEILKRYPIRIAVNNQFVNENASLSDGDSVALMPPVSGG